MQQEFGCCGGVAQLPAPLLGRTGACVGEGPQGGVCPALGEREDCCWVWGADVPPSLPSALWGRVAIQQQWLRLACAPWRGDTAISRLASGSWWVVRPDLWYCSKAGMLLAVLGWWKRLGAAGCEMGPVWGLPRGVACPQPASWGA